MKKRYDYDRNGIGFYIFDRIRGSDKPLGRMFERDDAELIVNALNYWDETSAKRSRANAARARIREIIEEAKAASR